MFASSTQLKFWTFSDAKELDQLRSEVNEKYKRKYLEVTRKSRNANSFLTPAEELLILRHYEYVLTDFCGRFIPAMPNFVVATALTYMKRFYLHNSVMDYCPKDMYLTFVYLACKVEEFNVSIQQFVSNVDEDSEKLTDLILAQELLIMQKLSYHLTIHNSFRPMEGFLIDIKTRFSDIGEGETLRPHAELFLDKSLHTDSLLLFPPSQVALAALQASAYANNVSIDRYLAQILLADATEETRTRTVTHVKKIIQLVKNRERLDRDTIHRLEKKLDRCRNPQNNPDRIILQQRQDELLDEDEVRAQKRRKLSDEDLDESMVDFL